MVFIRRSQVCYHGVDTCLNGTELGVVVALSAKSVMFTSVVFNWSGLGNHHLARMTSHILL